MHDNLIDEVKTLLAATDKLAAQVDSVSIKSAGVVRHVRDVDYWGLPFGTVIVPGGKGRGNPLTNVWANLAASKRGEDKDRDFVTVNGYRQYIGSDNSPVKGSSAPATYLVGKKGSKFVVIDETGKEIHSGKTELDALIWLNDHCRKNSESQYTRVKPEQGHREPPPGMRRATGEDLKMYKALNWKLVDIFVYENPDKHQSYGYGYKRDGKQQTFRKNDSVKNKQANKFARIRAMEPKMAKAEKKMRADSLEDNDTAKAVYMMRALALRVGSTGDKGTGATERSFGVTQMRVDQIKFTGNKAQLLLPSKRQGFADPVITDPFIVKMLRESVKGKKPGDKVFITNDDKTNTYVKNVFGMPDITNHNLRHYRATEAAKKRLDEWYKKYGLPETYEEFRDDWAIPLGEYAEQAVLFDKKGQAWKSYLDPFILGKIAPNNPEWIEDFVAKYGDKGVK